MLVDIEGAEIDALRGALKTIAASKPTIMVEVHWIGDDFKAFFETELAPLGYRLSTYSGRPVPEGITRYHALLEPK